MNIGIFGPRDFRGKLYANYNRVSDVLETFDFELLISGGGKGVEQLGLRFAEEKGIESKIYPPHIEVLGAKEAFERRNAEIIRALDVAVVLWDGKERFYGELISKILQAGKTAYVTGLE